MHYKCSPWLASQVALAASSLGSFEEARQMLLHRGCDLNIKTIIRMTKAMGRHARLGHSNLATADPKTEGVKGRKVVIAVDGGRLRIRKTKRGPKTKKGRHRYSTLWREPKLLIIYVTSPDGRMDKSVLPIIDGTLNGPDALFALLYHHLSLLNIGEADRILFVSDGATWIWKRIAPMLELFQSKQITLDVIELIDFYHAVQHLYAFAHLKGRWSKKIRSQWVNRQKRALKAGNIANVITEMKTAAKSSKNKQLRRELHYFIKNRERFGYDVVQKLNLPIGSGAIESAIRRVINLRLKSPCLYWKRETAEAMILLRSYYKSGRWEEINSLAHQGVLANAA